MVLQYIRAADPGTVVPFAVAIVYFGSQLPNTLFPYYFVNKFYKMRDEEDKELKTTKKTELIFNREVCESGIENENMADILTYVCRSDDGATKGLIAGRFTCMIGIPYYFKYETRADVDADDLNRIHNLKVDSNYRKMRRTIEWLFGGEGSDAPGNIDWNSPAGLAYKESLVLSPMAKRFAMTRLIQETDRFHLGYGFGAAFLGTEFAMALYRRSTRDMSPSDRRLIRGRYLFVTWAVGFAVWFYACKIRNNFFERTSDEKSAGYGPDFAEGGIEYYDKMLARNVALRELLGKDGEKRFTAKGNIRTSFQNWIRDFNIPLYHRSIASRRATVEKILIDFDEMTYEEMEYHLEAQRVLRRPRKTLFSPMKATFNWKNEVADELDRSAGVLEYDASLQENFKRVTVRVGKGQEK